MHNNQTVCLDGWHNNTELSVNIKTMMRSEKRMVTGKEYQGVLRRDSDAIDDEFLCRDAHFTFIEVEPWSTKRNPRVFNGRFISVTRRDDGSLRLNFKPLRAEAADFTIDGYAIGVCNEIRQALKGLVGESE